MNNLRTRTDSTPVDIAIKNNTYSVLAAGAKDLDLMLETDTGLLAVMNGTTYSRMAPRSTITANYIPKCKTASTGELENSAAAQTASEFVINGAEADLNFRVGTNGGSYGIYHDAGLGRTGFGEGTPAYRISITDANPAISLKNSDTGAIALINAASAAGTLAIDADAFDTVASSKLTLGVDSDVCVQIDDAGDVLVAKGDMVIPDGKGIYFCGSTNDKTSTGTIRMLRSGNDVITERWDGANWV